MYSLYPQSTNFWSRYTIKVELKLKMFLFSCTNGTAGMALRLNPQETDST
jgi:hypothetical protein